MITYIDNGASITLDGMSIPKDGGNRHYNEFLELLAAGEAELVQPAGPTLAEAQSKAILAATAACDDVLAPFGAEYGTWETATWDQQYAEALALMADPTLEAIPATQAEDKIPLLRSLTISRSTPDRTWTIPEMAQRIIRNRETWSVLTGDVIGQRLAIVDQINAASTVAEVLAVDVAITLPG